MKRQLQHGLTPDSCYLFSLTLNFDFLFSPVDKVPPWFQ
jgi:hypothetical protein